MFDKMCKVLVTCVLFFAISSFSTPAYHDGRVIGRGPRVINVNPHMEILHPIYVSITEINHNPNDRNLEIACKIFTDDFETVLTKSTRAKIDLFHPADSALMNKQIFDYVAGHLLIRVDNKPVALSMVGYERERDAVWSYFEVKNIGAVPKTINVRNSLLFEEFKEQINLLHVTVNGKRKSTKLDNPQGDAAFTW